MLGPTLVLHLFIECHLQSLEEEESRSSDCVVSILKEVECLFERAIHDAYPALHNLPCSVTPSAREEFGDYQCNSAMAIVGVTKLSFPCPTLILDVRWTFISAQK